MFNSDEILADTGEKNAYFTYIFIKGLFKKDKSINTSKFFSKKVEEDPILFLKNLIIDIKANS